jgi:hypothetical protein
MAEEPSPTVRSRNGGEEEDEEVDAPAAVPPVVPPALTGKISYSRLILLKGFL